MDFLGVSLTSLYRWEREGRLHPGTTTRGDSVRVLIVYDPEELARLPRRGRTPDDPGEITARVFELFESGAAMREIVIATRQLPAKIEELREVWLDGGGSDLVVSKAAKREIERVAGSFSTVGELVQKIIALAGVQEAP